MASKGSSGTWLLAAHHQSLQETGEPLVLTDRGRPVLRITRYAPAQETLAARRRSCVVRYDAATEPVAVDDWEAG